MKERVNESRSHFPHLKDLATFHHFPLSERMAMALTLDIHIKDIYPKFNEIHLLLSWSYDLKNNNNNNNL